MENEFKPIPISGRYSLAAIAENYGMTIEELKGEVERLRIIKRDLTNKQLDKGWTQEQAETYAMRCMYISGFSGPTFS